MKRISVSACLGAALVALVAMAAAADELTVSSILTAQQAGAPASGMIAMVNNPANTVAITAEDLVTLHNAGVPGSVLSAIWARIPAFTQVPEPLQPDDSRLVDTVRLIASGISEANIAEQVRQSGQSYNLSVNDLLYLKQNNAPESTIAALMATRPGTPAAPAVAPSELVFDNLVYLRKGFWRKDHQGRLVLEGDTLRWEDAGNPRRNFTFQASGLAKVWFTCDARSSGNFCYQINFQIVRGDRYRFTDSQRESGSNAAVTQLMEALRTYFPRLNYGTPRIDD